MPHEAEVGLDVQAARAHRIAATPERLLTDRVEDDVARFAVAREVFAGVVHDLGRAERAHQVDALGVADGRDLRTVAFAICTAAVPMAPEAP